MKAHFMLYDRNLNEIKPEKSYHKIGSVKYQ